MKMKERDIIFNKFGGRCAYCGCDLKKGWHVDHLEPVLRYRKTGWVNDGKPEVVVSGMIHPERETIENKMPSCPSCNNYKHANPLHIFRMYVEKQIEILRRDQPTFRMAERYGLIQCNPKPVVFYFEQISQNQPLNTDPYRI